MDEFWRRVRNHALTQSAAKNQRMYSRVFREWLEFLGVTPETDEAYRAVTSATESDAIEYIGYQRNQSGMTPRRGRKGTRANSTITLYCDILSSYYSRLVTAGYCDRNPFFRVKKPRKNSELKFPTELIPFDQVLELVHSPRNPLHRAILGTLAGTGIRISELLALSFDDVQISPQGTVFLKLINTKSGVDQTAVIPQWSLTLLMEWIAVRRELSYILDESFIFCAHGRETPMEQTAVRKMIKRYAQKLGLSGITPHSFRATAITKLLSDGVGHREVMRFSRHSSIVTVDWYDKRRLSIDESPGKKLKY